MPRHFGDSLPRSHCRSRKLGLGSRIELDEVVARVNGQPIRASEIFERACAEELQPSGMSLLAAARSSNRAK